MPLLAQSTVLQTLNPHEQICISCEQGRASLQALPLLTNKSKLWTFVVQQHTFNMLNNPLEILLLPCFFWGGVKLLLARTCVQSVHPDSLPNSWPEKQHVGKGVESDVGTIHNNITCKTKSTKTSNIQHSYS